MKRMILVLVCLVASVPVFGAGEEMKKLDFLLGEWSGEGSMQRGPKAETSFVHENVRSLAGGRVVAIEGRGNRKLEDGTRGDVVHDAFGAIWWDETAKKYRFSAFTAQAGHVDASFELTGEKAATWGFTTAQGQIRYHIRMTEAGDWNEVGEYSRDGQKWMQFFEMTLKRK